uniref:Uncharacterized protein n=1 Tax=Haptolina brevifila TaxID=156173 RepID=A0A7S2IEZ6_9EUKA
MREYACFLGALVATLTELYEPFGINDNLSIPVFASIALQVGFARVCQCSTVSSVSSATWLMDMVLALRTFVETSFMEAWHVPSNTSAIALVGGCMAAGQVCT